MGDAVGSILGGGEKAGSTAGADFQPFGYVTSQGTATGAKNDEGGFDIGIELSPELQALQQRSMAAASGLFPSYLEQIQNKPQDFSFNYDPLQAQQQMFQQQSALLDPVFAQQNQQLQSDLFGSGRMGLQLAGATAGAGRGGMVNPDAFGLARAQSQTYADLAASTRAAAMGEQAQLFGEAEQTYGLNDAARQQYLQNLAGGFTGMFGTANQIGETERAIAGQAVGFEQARANAKAGAATPATQGSGADLAGSSMMAAATYFGLSSDVRLKENIVPLGEVNGHKMYSWDWNSVAKSLGIDTPTVGVLAQEVMEYMPEAVREGSNGYYVVNYKMLEESL